MRPALPAFALAAALLGSATPPAARAATGVVLRCTLSYGTISPGYTTGTGTCTASGAVSGSVHLSFSASTGCPQSGANGTMSGALAAYFTWSRVGAGGVVQVTGNFTTSAGPMAFTNKCPTQGEPVTMSF
jgi:hypothetical protein